jgi:hypothetical protein
MLNVATAEAFNALDPSVVAPSLNVTVPVAVPGAVEVTVAVKVTDCPKSDGLADDTIAVAVAGKLTACVTVFDVLAAKLASPAYAAAIEWLPDVSVAVVNVATPATRALVPSVVAPSLKVMLPVGVPAAGEVTVAVKVTDWPLAEGLTDEISVVVVVPFTL